MQIYVLEKGLIYKLFMLLVFSFLTLIMYQGYLKGELIYTILFTLSIALCSFQIATIFYVLFVKRTVHLKIDENSVIWETFDNKRLVRKTTLNKKDIEEVKSEIDYLTGNIYSKFTVTFILKDGSQFELTDGLVYDFGLNKAKELSRYLLKNNLGDSQDIKFANLIKDLNIDIYKEQKFSKDEEDSHYVGIISKNKKEFLSLKIQIEALYKEFTIIDKNSSNEYFVRDENQKKSFIYLRSNAFGYFIEFYKVSKKENLKMLKELGRQKIGF